jgi:HEPN domain-containing protein
MNLRDDPTDPNTWLGRAQSSLILAEQGQSIAGVSLEDLCFHAQQAAETAFKAVCVKYNIAFPKTHSLVRLIDYWKKMGYRFLKISRQPIYSRYMLLKPAIQVYLKR